MLMENSNIEIIGGGLFFTEIEVKNDNEKFVPSESDKEAIRKNIEHKTGPVNMYIRLFFESLKNNPLVRILRRGCRSTCDK